MKVKLLKEVRREYEIYYNPKGILWWDDGNEPRYSEKCYKVQRGYSELNFETKNEAIDWILKDVRKNHPRKTPRVKHTPNEKIWYNQPKKESWIKRIFSNF